MRKKIKEIMNKEEGFTLVELLAVIVILGIIVAIAVPAVGNVISKAGDDADKAEIELVEDAARIYFTSEQPEGSTVTVKELNDDGYLELNEEKLTKLAGTVTKSDTGYNYEQGGS